MDENSDHFTNTIEKIIESSHRSWVPRAEIIFDILNNKFDQLIAFV